MTAWEIQEIFNKKHMFQELLKLLKEGLQGAVDHLRRELGGLRSGRASVDMVENIPVKAYDNTMTLKELGSISAPSPQELNIQVWDEDVVGSVMKAIEAANLGLSVSNTGNIIRAKLSPLSDERRQELARTAKKTTEEARIQIRQHREDALKKVKSALKDDEISEDDERKYRKDIQAEVDRANEQVEQLLDRKLEELQA